MYPVLSAVLNGLILATALTIAVSLALRLTPRRNLNAATRYVIWWITLGAVLVISVSFLLPRRRVEVQPSHLPAQIQTRLPPHVPFLIPARAATIPIHVPQPSAPWPEWPLLIW